MQPGYLRQGVDGIEVCILPIELEGSVLRKSGASSHLFTNIFKHGALLMSLLDGQPEARQNASHAIF